MGDIAFNIAKDVNLNKVVTLDILKTVDVNVNNPDQLATAEADAEAFGIFALAETDAYTYVTPTEAFSYAESTAALDLETPPPPTPGVWDGGTDQVGNVPVFLDAPILAPEDIPGDLTIDFNGPGDGTIPPDLDDVTGLGDFVPLFPPPSGFDTPIPVAGELEIDDLQLTRTEQAPITDLPGIIEAQYEITGGNWVVNYGQRTIDFATNGGGASEEVTGELTLTIPEGTLFLVEFLDEAPGAAVAEVEFEAFVNGGSAVFEIGDQSAEATFAFVADTDSIGGIGVADWAFNSIIIPPPAES